MPPTIPILHLDEALLVINKPSGLHTLPDGYDASLPYVRSLLEPEYGRLWIVHRLDRETSGVLALARSAEAHRHLNTQFAEHSIQKIYHALVLGTPEWKTQTVSLPLSTNRGHRHRTVVDPRRGKPAITHLRVLARYALYTLIEAAPETGRTHQIRAHLAALELPIAVDALYGDGLPVRRADAQPEALPGLYPEPPVLEHLALHARALTLTHPTSGERLTIEAPYPREWQELLHLLKRSRLR